MVSRNILEYFMTRKYILYYLICIVVLGSGCRNQMQLKDFFPHIALQTKDCIGVYGSLTVSREQFDRTFNDVVFLLDHMDPRIKIGLLNAHAKILVVSNEDEINKNKELVMSLLPAEAIFANLDGLDETIESGYGTGLSTTRLEFMNLVVYYSLLTEPELAVVYNELCQAFDEASKDSIFVPGKKYRDGMMDVVHQNASSKNALKYGRYLFCLYAVYYGNGSGGPPDISVYEKDLLREVNPLGYTFVRKYLAIPT